MILNKCKTISTTNSNFRFSNFCVIAEINGINFVNRDKQVWSLVIFEEISFVIIKLRLFLCLFGVMGRNLDLYENSPSETLQKPL